MDTYARTARAAPMIVPRTLVVPEVSTSRVEKRCGGVDGTYRMKPELLVWPIVIDITASKLEKII